MGSPNLILNRPQSDSLHALIPRRTQCLPWGRGVGKSFWLRQVGHILVGQHDRKEREGALKKMQGIRIVWLMPSLKQFKAVHGSAIETEIADDWAGLRGKLNRTDYRIEYPGGSWMQPFPAELHRSNFARGLRADVVILDETDDIDRSVFESVIRPWFSEPWSLKMVLAGGTPRKGRHGLLYHLHTLGLDPSKPRYWTRHATWADSPETVDPIEVRDAEENTPPAIFKREWLCDFDAAEGLVYGDVFDERFHIQEPPANAQWSEIIIGGDAGWEDPGVLLVIGIMGHGSDATAWVIDEAYEQHMTPSWWVGELQRMTMWHPGAKLYHDPSARSLIEEYRRHCSVDPQKVDNSIESGIRSVADRFLKRGRGDDQYAHLYISPKCKSLIWELGAYSRKPDPLNQDTYLEKPIDRNNHACLVAGTMVETGRGPVAIEDVKVGDLALTRDGFHRVTASEYTGDAETFVLSSVDGHRIEGSGDHPVWCDVLGWVSLEHVRNGDVLTTKDGISVAECVIPTGEIKPVYNLTVDVAHEYFANGILVSNCDALRYAIHGRFGKPQGTLRRP